MIAGGGKVDEIPPERTLVVIVLLGRELVVDEQIVSRDKAVTRQGEVSGSVLRWVGGFLTSVVEVIPLRDVVSGISWQFWKATWFEGSSTAVEVGQTGRAKKEIGLDMINYTHK